MGKLFHEIFCEKKQEMQKFLFFSCGKFPIFVLRKFSNFSRKCRMFFVTKFRIFFSYFSKINFRDKMQNFAKKFKKSYM